MQVFTTTADRMAWLTNSGRYAGEMVTDLETDQGYMLNAATNAWIPLASSGRFETLAALIATTDDYSDGAILTTSGFYAANDEGGATYIVSSSPLPGYTTDNVGQILLANGKYAILYHQGSLVVTQFGAKGDGVTNDLPAFRKALNYKKANPSLTTLFGVAGHTYYFTQQAPTYGIGNQAQFEEACFLYLGPQHSGLTLSGRGAKIIYDNNATQSYVYHVVGGQTNLYRCKRSNSGQEPNNILYWDAQYWQVMQFNIVDIDPSIPYWNANTQYYGGMSFCNMGTLSNYIPGQDVKNITWEDWDISGNDPDALASNEGYWNIFTKMFNNQEGIEDILYKRVKMHHCMSEVVYGGGYAHVKRVNVEECEIYKCHNAISHAGSMRIEGNILHDLGANGVESFSVVGDKQVYLNNKIYNAKNGIAVGGPGPGNDINVTGSILIQGNQIFNIDVYGIYLPGKIRHANIDSNQVYDCGSSNISLYALSNNGFPNVNSEVFITNNLIACYKKGGNGINLNSAHWDPNQMTGNIKISNNIFGATELSLLEGRNVRLGSCVDITGSLYRNIDISGNQIGAGVRYFVTYTVSSFAASIKNNYYTTGASLEATLLATNSFMDYTNPFVPTFSHFTGSYPTLSCANFATNVFYYKNPNVTSLPVSFDIDGFNLLVSNHTRLIILPNGDDNITRTKIIQGSGFGNKTLPVRFTKCSVGDGYSSYFEYIFSNNQLFLNDVQPVSAFLSGSLNAGDSTTVTIGLPEFLQLMWDSTNGFQYYDQFSFDTSVPTNIALDPNFQITAVSCVNTVYMTITIKNVSASTQSMDGKTVYLRVYPMSNPAMLPVNLQPLRKEGRTNMRPVSVNDDIPNFYLFHDTETNEYLYWDKKTSTWITEIS
jgi:hypothetical protein